MAWHPQTDRQTERVNQELDQYLQLFVNGWQNNWYDLSPMVEFQHNNHVHSAVRGPLTHDPRAPSVASQHNFIVQPLVTKEWNARAF